MLKDVCRNTIMKTVIKSVKPFLRLAWTNAQTLTKKIKIIVLDSITLLKTANIIFSDISAMYRHRSVTVLL